MTKGVDRGMVLRSMPIIICAGHPDQGPPDTIHR